MLFLDLFLSGKEFLSAEERTETGRERETDRENHNHPQTKEKLCGGQHDPFRNQESKFFQNIRRQVKLDGQRLPMRNSAKEQRTLKIRAVGDRISTLHEEEQVKTEASKLHVKPSGAQTFNRQELEMRRAERDQGGPRGPD